MAETGYSDGSEKPAGGSISREPNPAHPLAFIVSDTAEENISAVFVGDVASDFADRGLVIDGIFYATNTAVFSGGKTTVTFIASGMEFEDGENYACEFGIAEDYLPSAFGPSDWDLTDAETGGALNITIINPPAGATHYSYRVGSGLWNVRPNLDDYQITGLTDGVEVSVTIRAENAAGDSAASAAKTETPTSALVAPVIDFDGTTFSNVDGEAYQWTRDGVDIPGQAGITYAYNAATDQGRLIQQRNGLAFSNGFVVSFEEEPQIVDFTAPDGTKLSDYDGGLFTMSGGSSSSEQDKYTIQSNAVTIAQLSGAQPHAIALVDIGSPDHRFVTFGGGGNPPQVVVAADDASNFLYVEAHSTDLFFVVSNIGGTGTNLTPTGMKNTGATAAGHSPELYVVGDRFQYRINGLPYKPGDGFGGEAVQEDYWFTLPPALVGNTKVGLRGWEWSVLGADSVEFQSLDTPIMIDTAEIVGYDTAGVFNLHVRITGKCDSGVLTQAQTALLAADGTVLAHFADVAGAPGAGTTFTIDSQPIPSSYPQGGLTIYLRDKTGKDLAQSISDVFPPFFNTQWGFQASNVASWGDEDIYTDRGVITSWAAWVGDHWWGDVDGEVYPIEDNGTTNLLAVPGIVYAVAKIWESGMVGYGRGGLYEIKWQMEGVTASWINLVNATSGTVDNVNKTATINIGEMDHVGAHLRFDWTVPPTQDWNVEVTRIGETATGPLNDKVVEAFSGNDFYRWMKAMQMEHPYTPTADGLSIISPLCAKPELIGAASTQTGVRPWICFPTNENDAWTTDFATRLKTTIAPGMMIELELGNELEWNFTYASSNSVLQVRALNVGGFLPGAPVGGWIWGQDYTENTHLAASTLKVPVAAGSRVLLAGGNYQGSPILAKNDLPIGHEIPDIRPSTYYEDADMIIYSTYGALIQAMREYQVVRTAQIKQIFQDVFDGANEIRAYIGIQLGNNSFVDWLNAHPVEGKQIDGITPSHYTESNFRWAEAPAWFKNPADQETWLANFHTEQALGKIPGVISRLQTNKNAFHTLLALGWAPEEIPYIVTYEGELHASLQDIPPEFRAGIKANMDAYKESDEYYEFIQLLMAEIDALGLYGACDFAMHGVPRSGAIVDNFGYMRAVNSYNHPVTGWKDKKWFAREDYLASR